MGRFAVLLFDSSFSLFIIVHFVFNFLFLFVCSCVFVSLSWYLQVDFNQDGFIDYVQQGRYDNIDQYGLSYLFLSVPPSTPTFTEDATVFDTGRFAILLFHCFIV